MPVKTAPTKKAKKKHPVERNYFFRVSGVKKYDSEVEIYKFSIMQRRPVVLLKSDLIDYTCLDILISKHNNWAPLYNGEFSLKHFYTTNEIEVPKGINHKIKEFTAGAQIDQSILAMRGSGEYIVSKYFRHYEYSIGRWSQLTSEDKLNKAMTEITITAILLRKTNTYVFNSFAITGTTISSFGLSFGSW
ncbi:hypothetical protein BpHYR1_038521 [Brachionus plicatilis]|uniref:Uncharacterized protein n=1 Tax=Brachionus plicatilis TaxID=10195 RepID=A0A3M7Q0N7_BRAPC|nr:hypothetical protein BpHYR1_038521 [Brachionus plicatilis]